MVCVNHDLWPIYPPSMDVPWRFIDTWWCYTQQSSWLTLLTYPSHCVASVSNLPKILQCDWTTLYSAAGHDNMCMQFTSPFPFLRKWVWLVRLCSQSTRLISFFFSLVCLQYNTRSSASMYYTECKPKNKKMGEAWERGYRLIVL